MFYLLLLGEYSMQFQVANMYDNDALTPIVSNTIILTSPRYVSFTSMGYLSFHPSMGK